MSNYTKSYFDEKNTNHSWYKALSMIAKKSAILDIGCSSGHFGAVLVERKKCLVDGVEPDEGDARRARKYLRIVHELNIETDPLDAISKKYDYIYFGDVVEHLFYPIQTLERVKKLLKPDGGIIFSIPNMGHISVRLELLKGNFEYTETGLLDKTHIHFYNQDEVERVFSAAGYQIEQLDFVTKDYPKKLLDKELAQTGLKAGEKFYKLAASSPASAFQFVGLARPMPKVKIKKLKQFGPIDHFESFYNGLLASHKEELAERENYIRELERKVGGSRTRGAQKKITHNVRRVKRKLTKTLRP